MGGGRGEGECFEGRKDASAKKKHIKPKRKKTLIVCFQRGTSDESKTKKRGELINLRIHPSPGFGHPHDCYLEFGVRIEEDASYEQTAVFRIGYLRCHAL